MEESDQSVETSDHPIMPENSDSEDIGDNPTKDSLIILAGLFILSIFPVNVEDLESSFLSLGAASLIYMWLDPLFLYVPLINEDIKCVMVDNKLKRAALVLRSFSDLRYLIRIIGRIKNGKRESQSLKKIALSTAVDTVSLLPIPQAVVLIFLPQMRGSSSMNIMKLLNFLIVLQYLARVYPMYQVFKQANEEERARLEFKRVSIFVNFFGFLLASHVLGAFWYFFSIQREISCWGYAGQIENGTEFSTSCDRSAFRNVTLIHNSCPINPPNASIFDFGIFLYALQSGMQGSTNFSQKLFQCFSWGLRNLSSFASNLNTSTYGWENLFVVSISISGLVLFMYLLGHVQTFMQGMTISNSLQLKMNAMEPKIQTMLSEYKLHSKEMESKVKRVVKEILKKEENLIVENLLSILSSDLTKVNEAKDLAMEIKCSLFMNKLKQVDGLKDKKEDVLENLCDHFQPMIYSKGCYIIREGEPLDMMFFITGGSVLTYMANNGGSNGSSGIIQLEKENDGLYGKELLTWVKEPSSKLSNLPFSDITIKSHNKVEVFALQATDLQHVVSKFPSQFNTDIVLTIGSGEIDLVTTAAAQQGCCSTEDNGATVGCVQGMV